MRNGGKTRFKRTKIDELLNYTVYTVSVGGVSQHHIHTHSLISGDAKCWDEEQCECSSR